MASVFSSERTSFSQFLRMEPRALEAAETPYLVSHFA